VVDKVNNLTPNRNETAEVIFVDKREKSLLPFLLLKSSTEDEKETGQIVTGPIKRWP